MGRSEAFEEIGVATLVTTPLETGAGRKRKAASSTLAA